MTIEPLRPSQEIAGDAERLQRHEQSRLRAAAMHARRVHPGALGELVARELSAYADFGYRFSGDPLIPRLATEILATSTRPHVAGSEQPNAA